MDRELASQTQAAAQGVPERQVEELRGHWGMMSCLGATVSVKRLLECCGFATLWLSSCEDWKVAGAMTTQSAE